MDETMDETMNETMQEESYSPKKKSKKSKKRKHEESDDHEESKREELKSKSSKDRKSKGVKKEAKKRDYEEDRLNDESDQDKSDQDDLFQQESIQGDAADLRLDEEEKQYELFGEEQEEEPEPVAEHRPKLTAIKCEPFSCVEHVNKTLKIALLPVALSKGVLKVIKDILVYDWKYSFVSKLNGFLYYFENLELVEEPLYRLLDDLPFFYPRITADFYVFRPKIGEYLRATITCFEDSNKVIQCSTSCQLTISIQLPEQISDQLNRYLNLKQDIIFLIQSIDYKQSLIEGTINERSLRLMEEHVEINEVADDPDADQHQSNLEDFFVNS